MKIAYYSDLHIEHSNILLDTKKADVVVLAGDIYALGASYVKPVSTIDWIQDTFPDTPVVFVPGNHDFELSHMEKQYDSWRNQCAQTNGHVHCLWNDEVVLGDTRFLGTPLFTNFASTNNQQKCMEIAKNIVDFNAIGYKGRLVTPFDYIDLFNQSCDYLHKELNNPSHQDKTHVVVTHFAPATKCQNPNLPSRPESAYWASDCEDLIQQSNIWISGHTHFSFKAKLGDDPKHGHLFSNARGYSKIMGLSSDKNFKKDMLLDTKKVLFARTRKKVSGKTP